MMTTTRLKLMISIIAICLVVIAGCSGGETDPRPGSGDIGIHYNNGNFSESAFFLNVTIDFTLNVEEETTFDHVMFCLYDDEGEVLNSADLGRFTTPQERVTVNLTSESRPQFLIVDHPKFGEYGTIGPFIRAWSESQEHFVRAGTSDLPFEYPRSDEVGECR